jgi:hypothetical protein
MVAQDHNCGEAHGKVVTQIDDLGKQGDRFQKWIGDVQGELQAHALLNGGGKGHVSRREFDSLEVTVKDIRKWLVLAAIGVLTASGGGSMLAPTIKAIVLKQLGGG